MSSALVDSLRKLADEFESKQKSGPQQDTDTPKQEASKPPTGYTRHNMNEHTKQIALFAGVLLGENESTELATKVGAEVLRDVWTAIREAHDAAGLPQVTAMSWQDVRREYATMLETVLERIYDKMAEVDPSFETAISFE